VKNPTTPQPQKIVALYKMEQRVNHKKHGSGTITGMAESMPCAPRKPYTDLWSVPMYTLDLDNPKIRVVVMEADITPEVP
jgi:hypothetical protein